MVPCPSCGSHVRRRDPSCFACGTLFPATRNATAAALMLGLVACTGGTTTTKDGDTGDTGFVTQAEYGATVTDTTTAMPAYGVTVTDHTADPGHSATTTTPPDSGHSGHSGAH